MYSEIKQDGGLGFLRLGLRSGSVLGSKLLSRSRNDNPVIHISDFKYDLNVIGEFCEQEYDKVFKQCPDDITSAKKYIIVHGLKYIVLHKFINLFLKIVDDLNESEGFTHQDKSGQNGGMGPRGLRSNKYIFAVAFTLAIACIHHLYMMTHVSVFMKSTKDDLSMIQNIKLPGNEFYDDDKKERISVSDVLTSKILPNLEETRPNLSKSMETSLYSSQKEQVEVLQEYYKSAGEIKILMNFLGPQLDEHKNGRSMRDTISAISFYENTTFNIRSLQNEDIHNYVTGLIKMSKDDNAYHASSLYSNEQPLLSGKSGLLMTDDIPIQDLCF